MPCCLAESQMILALELVGFNDQVTAEYIPVSDAELAGDADGVPPDSERESSAARLTFAITFCAPPAIGFIVVAKYTC